MIPPDGTERANWRSAAEVVRVKGNGIVPQMKDTTTKVSQ